MKTQSINLLSQIFIRKISLCHSFFFSQLPCCCLLIKYGFCSVSVHGSEDFLFGTVCHRKHQLERTLSMSLQCSPTSASLALAANSLQIFSHNAFCSLFISKIIPSSISSNRRCDWSIFLGLLLSPQLHYLLNNFKRD